MIPRFDWKQYPDGREELITYEVLATYTLQLIGPLAGKLMGSSLEPAFLRETEENLTDLLPRGYSVRIKGAEVLMSTIFEVRCETCGVSGPKIRRSGAVTFCNYSITGPFTSDYHTAANDAWGVFLNEHEFHDLRLLTGP